VEKAHPDVMDLLLQILEEGRLTDSFGRKVSFRHAIVIMTSNLGADLIRRNTEVGFVTRQAALDYKSIQEKIEASVKKHFKPEFMNRIDGMVIFKPLNEPALEEIVHLEIEKVKSRLAKRQVHIEITHEAIALLVKLGNLPEMGARPLRRAIEQYMEDPLAEKLLQHPGEAHRYLVKAEGEKLVFEEQPVLETAQAG
jgi:ATP-dependent Clp protease ATP-binding subunit ClpC